MKNRTRLTGLALMLCVAGLSTGCATAYKGAIDWQVDSKLLGGWRIARHEITTPGDLDLHLMLAECVAAFSRNLDNRTLTQADEQLREDGRHHRTPPTQQRPRVNGRASPRALLARQSIKRAHGLHRQQPPLELRRRFGGRVPPQARDDRHRGRHG